MSLARAADIAPAASSASAAAADIERMFVLLRNGSIPRRANGAFALPLHQTEITMILSKVPEPKMRRFHAGTAGRPTRSTGRSTQTAEAFLMTTYERNPNPRGTGNGGWIVGAIIVVLVIIGLFYWGGSSTNTASNAPTPP